MKNKRRNVIFIIFALIMGIFMFLADIFFSINNWKLMIIAGIGLFITIFILLHINKKEIDSRKNQ